MGRPSLRNPADVTEYLRTHSVEEAIKEFKFNNKNHFYTYCSFHKIDRPSQKVEWTFHGMNLEEFRDYCRNKTIKTIVEETGESRSRIANILYNKKIEFIHLRHKGDGNRDEMIAYLSQEFSYRDVGELFNLTRQRVEQIVRKEEKNPFSRIYKPQ